MPGILPDGGARTGSFLSAKIFEWPPATLYFARKFPARLVRGGKTLNVRYF